MNVLSFRSDEFLDDLHVLNMFLRRRLEMLLIFRIQDLLCWSLDAKIFGPEFSSVSTTSNTLTIWEVELQNTSEMVKSSSSLNAKCFLQPKMKS